MAADGMIANGIKIGYSAASPVSWNAIGQLLSVGGIKLTRAKIARTVHSTNIFNRYLPGMADVADVALEILQDPDEGTTHGAVQEALRALLTAGTTVWWRIEFPTDRVQTEYKPVEFQGFVTDFEISGGAPEDRQTFTVTVAFDGDSVSIGPAGATAIT